MKKLLAFSVICLTLATACSKKISPSTTETKKETPAEATTAVTPPPQQAIKLEVPTATPVELGKNVYNTKCGRCHALKNTFDYTADRWDGILRSMAPKAKLTEEETSQVTAYVKANCKQ